ncbi:hypothetical protein Hanom_Chr06g00546901 [Helianthus anomalus]
MVDITVFYDFLHFLGNLDFLANSYPIYIYIYIYIDIYIHIYIIIINISMH